VRWVGRGEWIALHQFRASSDRWRVWVTVVSTTKAFLRHDLEPCQPGLFAKSGPISHITPFSIGSRSRRLERGLAEKPLAAAPLLSASERSSRYWQRGEAGSVTQRLYGLLCTGHTESPDFALSASSSDHCDGLPRLARYMDFSMSNTLWAIRPTAVGQTVFDELVPIFWP
jgi:hypothetical protein